MSSWRSRQRPGDAPPNQGGRWGGRRGDLEEPEFDPTELAERSLFVGSGGSDPIRRAAAGLADFWKGRHNGRATVNAGARDAAMPHAGRWGGRSPGLAMDTQEKVRFSKSYKLADDIDVELVWRLYQHPSTGAGEREAARQALIRLGQDPNSRQSASAKSQYQYEPPKSKPAAASSKRFRVTLRYTVDGKTLYYGPVEVTATDQIDAEGKAREMARQHWRQTVGGSVPQFEAYRTERV